MKRNKIISTAGLLFATSAALASVSAPALAKTVAGPNHATSYLVVTAAGKVCSTGGAHRYGNGHGRIVGIQITKDGKGYWLVEKNGKVEKFGDAKKFAYKKAKTVKWTRALGSCKKPVAAAVEPKVKTTAKTTTTTTTTPAKTTTMTSPAPTVASTAVTSTSSSLGAAEVGEGYNAQLTATGGSGGYSWTVVSGELPAGLTLGSTGVLSGTPTTAGSSTFTVEVSDSASTALAALTLNVSPAPIAVTTTSSALGSSEQGVSYNHQLAATGGSGTYSWSVSSGSLPSGISLSSSGVLSGTPTTYGTASFTVKATGDGETATQTLSLSVAQALAIMTTSVDDPVELGLPIAGTAPVPDSDCIPNANGNSYTSTGFLCQYPAAIPYSEQLASSGGQGEVTWSLTSNSSALPAGMTLSSSGVLSGTPDQNTAGSYTFTAQAVDALGAVATHTFTILVATYSGASTWAGYVEQGASAYGSVSGTFSVPETVAASFGLTTDTGATSAWVGVDGDEAITPSDSYLLQAGFDIHDGVYQAWTEEANPTLAAPQYISDFTVDPGDSITVTITDTDPVTDQWTIALDDTTSGSTYSTTVTYDGPASMAEWIGEAPNLDGTGAPYEGPDSFVGSLDVTDMQASQPATSLTYTTSAPTFTPSNFQPSVIGSMGFAIADDEHLPAPLS